MAVLALVLTGSSVAVNATFVAQSERSLDTLLSNVRRCRDRLNANSMSVR